LRSTERTELLVGRASGLSALHASLSSLADGASITVVVRVVYRRSGVQLIADRLEFPLPRASGRASEPEPPRPAERSPPEAEPRRTAPAPTPRTSEPPGRVCGDFETYLRQALFIEPSLAGDFVTCFCLAGGLLDLVDASPYLAPIASWVEVIDCACNVLTILQHVYNIGVEDGCWDWDNVTWGEGLSVLNLSLSTIADCSSLPLGASLGALLGGLGGGAGGSGAAPGPGTAAGAGAGAGAGAILGDLLVDVAAMAMQNIITQGTPFPVNQCRACVRLAHRVGVPDFSDAFCGPARSTPNW
jgi:hypothetical protein